MKKILATLLVATMIMSCMSFVSFAASFTSFSNMLSDNGLYAFDAVEESFSDAFYAYAPFVEGEKGLSSKSKKTSYANSGKDPIYTYVYNEDIEADKVTAIDATTDAYIMMPIIVDEALVGCDFDITYNKDLLTFAGLSSDFMSDYLDKSDSNETGLTTIGVSQEPEGLVAAAFFTVNAEYVGDVDGKATATIVADCTSAKVLATDAQIADTVEDLVMTVDIINLVPGAPAEEEKPSLADEATIDAIEATFKSFTVAADSDLIKDNGIEGADAYVAVFGEIDLTEKAYAEKIVDYGFYYVAGSNKLKNADASVAEKAKNGKFGCIFYGTKWAVENGEAVFYVTYEDAEGNTQTVYSK